MEDAHCALIGLQGLDDWSFFAVFDGHAGASVSAHCAKQLLNAIRDCTDLSELSPETVKEGIKTGFLRLDEQMREMPEIVSGEDKSGSTAVCAFVSSKHIFFANCGDSRAVLSRGGRVSYSTEDHKPMNPLEKERIQNAGGSVMIQRVNGSLAVSRALGDFEYKNVQGKGPCEQLVSPEPEIGVEERTEGDEFVILACDGIWDVMTNEELCDFVRDRMRLTDNLETICHLVVDTCLFKGSRDNMSIVIIALKGAPVVSEVAKKKEEELERRLEEKIKDILEHSCADSPPEAALLPYVMHELTACREFEGLPPGGGLVSKRSFIEDIIRRLHPVHSDSD